MTVNNNTATLNEPLILYQHDRGLTLRIKVLKYKFMFNKLMEEDMVADTSIISARAIVLKPDGQRVFECPRQAVEDDYVIINITLDWTDELLEIGQYKLQIQLYGSDYINERVTLPPIEFTVAKPIGFVAEDGLEYNPVADGGITDISEIDEEGHADDDGDLPYGIYEEINWKSGDAITAANLNKMDDAIEYLVRTQKAKAIFTPSVSTTGIISWTNDLELENPAPVNIKGPKGAKGDTGEKGDKGDKGDTGEKGQDGTVAFDELTEEQRESLKGEQGPAGANGKSFTYDDLTDAQKADLTQGFITCSDNITRIEVVTEYPEVEEEGVLYIKVGE